MCTPCCNDGRTPSPISGDSQSRAPECGFDPRLQLDDAQGLAEVIVRSCRQQLRQLIPRGSSGKHDNAGAELLENTIVARDKAESRAATDSLRLVLGEELVFRQVSNQLFGIGEVLQFFLDAGG